MEYVSYIAITGVGIITYKYIISPIVSGINQIRGYLPETLITDDIVIRKRVEDIISKRDIISLYISELSGSFTSSTPLTINGLIDKINLTIKEINTELTNIEQKLFEYSQKYVKSIRSLDCSDEFSKLDKLSSKIDGDFGLLIRLTKLI
jgi:hypothetical protein